MIKEDSALVESLAFYCDELQKTLDMMPSIKKEISNLYNYGLIDGLYTADLLSDSNEELYFHIDGKIGYISKSQISMDFNFLIKHGYSLIDSKYNDQYKRIEIIYKFSKIELRMFYYQ